MALSRVVPGGSRSMAQAVGSHLPGQRLLGGICASGWKCLTLPSFEAGLPAPAFPAVLGREPPVGVWPALGLCCVLSALFSQDWLANSCQLGVLGLSWGRCSPGVCHQHSRTPGDQQRRAVRGPLAGGTAVSLEEPWTVQVPFSELGAEALSVQFWVFWST